MKHEDVQVISTVFNPKGRTNISSRDLFSIIDQYCKAEDRCELECKFIVCKADAVGMNVERFVVEKMEFEKKLTLLPKTNFSGKC